jgi:3-hydroxyisobutyrate dehydrogenase-like beta-hydroxyacid dehydrogenase
VAWAVHGFPGVYVDANAISPVSAREVARMISDSGGSYVDGGIIGSPPEQAGTTRLYLSGPRAGEVADLLAGSPLDARVLTGRPTAASAVKMAYAAWTKGSAALLLTAQALARSEGVEEALTGEWAQSQPGLAAQSVAAARSSAAKGWRWVAEMEEIATSMAAAGLPDGFHQAAAEVYRRAPARASTSAPLDGPVRENPVVENPVVENPVVENTVLDLIIGALIDPVEPPRPPDPRAGQAESRSDR